MATALEFLKEQLSDIGGFMATALKFLMELLRNVGGFMATPLEFLKEPLRNVGGFMATPLEFLKELLRNVGGFMATTLGLLKENPSSYAGALQDKRKEIEEALKGLKERLGDHHPQKEKLLQGLKESIAEFHREKLPNLYQVLLNKRKELGGGLQGPKETTSQFLQEKISWLIALWKAVVDFLVQNLEALLLPGTSSDTVRIWVQLCLPLLLFLSLPFLHYFLYACAKAGYWAIVMITACARASYWAIEMIKACARAAWGTTKGGGGKMMKAPGRPDVRIRRADFESDPRSYFRVLHANAPWQGAWPNSKSKWFIIVVGVVTVGVGLLKLR